MEACPNCIDCDVEVGIDDYFCTDCGKKRMERYCKFCKKYSYFRHTEDTSISFGVTGGSARWSQTTFAYLPPRCESCERDRISDPFFGLALFGWIIPWILFLAVADIDTIWFLISMIVFPLGSITFSLILSFLFDPDFHGETAVLENHILGLYLRDGEKSIRSKKYNRKVKNIKLNEGIIPLLDHFKRKEWVDLCESEGIDTKSLTIKEMKNRILASNKIIRILNKHNLSIEKKEIRDFISKNTDFVLLSDSVIFHTINNWYPSFEVPPTKISLLGWRSRKKDWIDYCHLHGLDTENLTIKKMEYKVEAHNILVDYQKRHKTEISTPERIRLSNEYFEFIVISKTRMVEQINNQYPHLDVSGMSMIECLRELP